MSQINSICTLTCDGRVATTACGYMKLYKFKLIKLNIKK